MWEVIAMSACFGMVGLCWGHWLGRQHEALDWRDKARDSTAYCSDGRFFYVRTEHDYVELNNAAARCRQYERGQPVRRRA